ncbi:MAG: sensor histidine kinase [Cryobacterium sp.]|nr:sensor histidine kinase [Cryobacterium sp.]
MIRKLSTSQLAVDIALPSALLLVLLVPYFAAGGVLRTVVLAGTCAALAVRRWSPLLSLAIVWIPSLWQVVLRLEPDPLSIAVLPVLYSTARYGDRATKWLGLASAGLGAFIIAVYLILGQPGSSTACWPISGDCLTPGTFFSRLNSFAVLFVLFAALFVLSWSLGLLMKTLNRARVSSQAQRAAEQSVVVEQERNRIARDMHDVVAHSLAVVIAQADGARYARGRQQDAVDSAFETISSTARDALTDVRVLLAQLRRSESHAPQRALADLDRLVGQFRASGLDVVMDREGEPDEPGLGVELAIYRIVQEALTNALRHGNVADPVTVDFDWRSADVRLRIANSVAAERVESDLGHGLAGMRERAQLAGGAFEVSDDGERFTVVVTLPLGAGVAS